MSRPRLGLQASTWSRGLRTGRGWLLSQCRSKNVAQGPDSQRDVPGRVACLGSGPSREPGAQRSREVGGWGGGRGGRGKGSAGRVLFALSWSNKRHEDTHPLICAGDPCLASLPDRVPISLTRVCAHKVRESSEDTSGCRRLGGSAWGELRRPPWRLRVWQPMTLGDKREDS